VVDRGDVAELAEALLDVVVGRGGIPVQVEVVKGGEGGGGGESVTESVLVGVEEDALGVVVAGAAVRQEGEDVAPDGLVERELGRHGLGLGR
jgi:hypothetical protein